MNISPISCSKLNFNSYINKQNYNTKALDKDVFIKTTSFGSSARKNDLSFEAFEEWAEETNFIDNALQMINETAPILGSGFEGTTYGIPGCDRWVMKEYKRSNLLCENLKKPRITKITDVSPDLNIGQFIASVKIPVSSNLTQNFYVLKRQQGKSYGVQYSERDFMCDSNATKHKESLKTLANFPQESYNKLLNDIEYINKQGYQLDCVNPYNFMIDTENQTINFVDANDRREEKGMQYGDVLFALLDGDFAKTYEMSDRPENEKEEVREYSSQICSKFLIAMSKKQAQFSPSEKFLKVYNSSTFEGVIGESDPVKKEDLMITLGLY